MDLDITKIEEKYAVENENGEKIVDYTKVNEEVKQITQLEIDKVAKKKDDKTKRKIEELQSEYNKKMANQTQTDEEKSSKKLKELETQITQMQNQSKRLNEESNFKARAKSENVPDEIVNTLLKSVQDLDSLDLSPFKTTVETVTPVSRVDKTEENVQTEKNNIQSALDDYRKYKKNRI